MHLGVMFLDYTFYPDNMVPIEIREFDVPASLFFKRAEALYDNFPVNMESNKKMKVEYGLE